MKNWGQIARKATRRKVIAKVLEEGGASNTCHVSTPAGNSNESLRAAIGVKSSPLPTGRTPRPMSAV